ncbi:MULTISPECIES: hypothetical protein [unclassified Polaribacter]|uniref:hypothetical protein n=1 Tax=unclassified Polaribacter TaxID=196858 RepID=UPI0011BD9675|nr:MULTISPECIES: hypothetical protein [unclassified Polaribacter]TXD54275.1 hypothetical protein ES043_00025 [Polaribacter sp. IC063]TXD62894.1 hypothetical protein ES044_00735 [Polaribacter sp. IC066]
MKKLLLTLTLFVGAISLNAQDISNNAIGLRFSGGNGFGGEISYQKALNDNNRLEIDLGLGNGLSDFKATGLYQWVWTIEDRFNWYAGFGAGLISTEEVGIYGAGVIGIEYNFNAPFILSLDYRPEAGITGDLNGLSNDFAFSIRYQF